MYNQFKETGIGLFIVSIALCLVAVEAKAQDKKEDRFSFVHLADQQRVDVLLDNKLFTSYRYADSLKKPILFPLKTIKGHLVTRGWPIEPRANERTDHPHQMGLWFNYGDVNGLDFWNNSTEIPQEKRMKYGEIVHAKVNSFHTSADSACLEVCKYWLAPLGDTLILENSCYKFHVLDNNTTAIEVHLMLKALEEVSFKDNKEGLLALRVARELEQPFDQATTFTDQQGIAQPKSRIDNSGVTGNYVSSEGKMGDDVFGTRGRWASLNGVVDGERVSILILDHPNNVGYPTYWFARGYGLFAANPLGQKVFSKEKEELNYRLGRGESVKFKYKVVIVCGNYSETVDIERMADDFSRE